MYSRCISFECEELSSGNRRKRGSLPLNKFPFPFAALQRGIKILSHWAGSWELRRGRRGRWGGELTYFWKLLDTIFGDRKMLSGTGVCVGGGGRLSVCISTTTRKGSWALCRGIWDGSFRFEVSPPTLSVCSSNQILLREIKEDKIIFRYKMKRR